MRRLRALRALARVELRALRRHPARSALVLLLVAVPVAALAGGSALFATARPTLEERRAEALGRAALRAGPGAAALLPADARVEAIERVDLVLVGPEGALRVPALALDLDGLAAGMLRVTAGRAPAAPGELALSPAWIDRLGVGLGARAPGRDGAEHTLVGVVVAPESLERPVALLAPDTARAASDRLWLVDLPGAQAAPLAAELRAAGVEVLLREELRASDGFEALALFVVGGFGFFEAALVVAAAFAVGVRRRQRELGLLGASGAAPADLRLAMLASAAALAAAGSALGGAVGVAAAHALRPFLDGWNGRWNGPLELSAPHLVGALALGLVSATAAAALPARGATRLPVRVALSGRRPLAGSSRRGLAVGLLAGLGGLALLGLAGSEHDATAGLGVLAGSALAVTGLGLASPWLLGALARRAARLPLDWRLAVRDAGRFRARNGPVVTAVLAALSISVLMATVFESVARSTGARALDAGPERTWLLVLLALCVLTGLVIVLIATALSAVESAADARVLRAVGAHPGLLRRLAAARAAWLALLGCVLALPAGLVPAAGLMRLADVELRFALPWPELLAALLLLPAVAWAVTWTGAALRAPRLDHARSLDAPGEPR